LNDGSPTYHSTNSSSALDITACKGDMPTSWRVVDDDIRSDHSAILIQLGRDGPIERVCIKDWSKMNWEQYEQDSKPVLEELIVRWDQKKINSKTMNEQLCQALTDLAGKLVPEKVICKHSKPWFSQELSDQLKKQNATKRNWKRRRSQRNYILYQDTLKETENMIEASRRAWWEEEVSKLDSASQPLKWKIINRLTKPDLPTGIQPVKRDGKYLFQDEEILEEMEKYHIAKDNSDITEDRSILGELQKRLDNNNTRICKAHNVSIRAESEAPMRQDTNRHVIFRMHQ